MKKWKNDEIYQLLWNIKLYRIDEEAWMIRKEFNNWMKVSLIRNKKQNF